MCPILAPILFDKHIEMPLISKRDDKKRQRGALKKNRRFFTETKHNLETNNVASEPELNEDITNIEIKKVDFEGH